MLEKIKNGAAKLMNRITLKKYEMMEAASEAGREVKKEKGSAELVVVIFLIVIAIGLIIIFRDQITALIQKVFSKGDSLVDSTF